jgi:site-specific recombinase XerD
MFRRDLEAVGIAYAVNTSDGPEHADFHALRHSFLTMRGRHGVDLRAVRELGRGRNPPSHDRRQP